MANKIYTKQQQLTKKVKEFCFLVQKRQSVTLQKFKIFALDFVKFEPYFEFFDSYISTNVGTHFYLLLEDA